jgi:hypothetical protein
MKKLLLALIFVLVLIPNISFSADTYKLLEPLPCIDGVGNCKAGNMQTEININDYILYVYKFSIGISVFLAIIMIIWGGFLTITSEIPYIKTDGKGKITNALTGLVMVLISYLILATIDPRLVNINTTIEPIKINESDLKAVKDFKGALVNDLRDVNTENQIKFQEIDSQIKELEKEKADIASKIERGEIATPEEAELRKKDLDSQIKEAKVNKTALLAENTGASSYATALSNIDNSENLFPYIAPVLPNTVGTFPRPINSENIIQNQYNEKINAILATSNTSGDKIQTLERQRDFYIEQIKEDFDIKTKIEKNGTIQSTGTQGPGIKIDNNDYLMKKVDAYKADIVNLDKQIKSGLPLTDYSRIIQTKINTIEQAIDKTEK